MFVVSYEDRTGTRVVLKYQPWTERKDEVVLFDTKESAQQGVDWLKAVLPTNYHLSIVVYKRNS